jgi:hypothetical protein
MRCSDGHYYVVKFQNNPQHTRILVNEMLGTRLAARLGLPTTPVAVVEVSPELVRLTPELCVELPRARVPCTPGLVQTISVSRSPMACKEYAYTAQYIAPRAESEFAAITDVPLDNGNLRHRFVRDTLRDAGIEPIPMEGSAVWVAKLKPLLQ